MSQLVACLAIIGVLALASAVFVALILVFDEREHRRQTARMYADRVPSKSLVDVPSERLWADFDRAEHPTHRPKENP